MYCRCYLFVSSCWYHIGSWYIASAFGLPYAQVIRIPVYYRVRRLNLVLNPTTFAFAPAMAGQLVASGKESIVRYNISSFLLPRMLFDALLTSRPLSEPEDKTLSIRFNDRDPSMGVARISVADQRIVVVRETGSQDVLCRCLLFLHLQEFGFVRVARLLFDASLGDKSETYIPTCKNASGCSVAVPLSVSDFEEVLLAIVLYFMYISEQ